MPEYNLPLARGAYQNNGASPWYSPIPVGSKKLVMKLALDTGTNMDWVTSTQCQTYACTMPGRVQFDPKSSDTFRWVDAKTVDLDYGPWGTLKANTGRDQIGLPDGSTADITMGLAVDYEGEKFIEVDWDGCIALPAVSKMQDDMTFLFEEMINTDQIDTSTPFFGFDTDPSTGTGKCIFGGFDEGRMDTSSILYLPYELYTIPGTQPAASIPYIWSTPLAQVLFDGTEICRNATFCLDTGSSRFKGDGSYMNAILSLASQSAGSLHITVGQDLNGQPGQIVVPSSVYEHTIEKGTGTGKTAPQFHELASVTGLFLAGSILMDHLYTIHQYRVMPNPNTDGWMLSPLGMFITNKPGGPKIIQNSIVASADMKTLLAENLERAEKGSTP